MKSFFSILTVLILATSLVSCSNKAVVNNSSTQSPIRVESSSESSLASSLESSLEDWTDTEFLEKAYEMGYTDNQLELLNSFQVSKDTVLNLTDKDGYSWDEIESPNGGYILDEYFVAAGGEAYCGCVYFKNNNNRKVTILPDWQNGYSSFGFLDNERFFAAISQVGGADYEAGIRFYNVNNPKEPYYRWDLTNREADENKSTEKRLLGVNFYKETKQIIAAFCEIPKQWCGRVEDDSKTYQFIIFDYEGNIEKRIDTKIPLRHGKLGILYPDYAQIDINQNLNENKVYFSFYNDDKTYELNLISGEIGCYNE